MNDGLMRPCARGPSGVLEVLEASLVPSDAAEAISAHLSLAAICVPNHHGRCIVDDEDAICPNATVTVANRPCALSVHRDVADHHKVVPQTLVFGKLERHT